MLELQPEGELVEELAEHLAAERAHRMDLVLCRIPFQKNGGERLRRRAGNHARAFGRVVLAVLRAAVDDVGDAVARALLAAEADEADVLGRIGQPVRADRRVGDHRAARANPAFPLVGRAGHGFQLRRLHRLAQVQQKAGRRRERIVEDEVAVDRDGGGTQRLAFLVDQPRPRVELHPGIGADGRGADRRGRGGAKLDEAPAFHPYRLYPFSLCSTVSSPSVSSSLATRMPTIASTSLSSTQVSTPDQTAVTATPMSWVTNCSPMVTFSG